MRRAMLIAVPCLLPSLVVRLALLIVSSASPGQGAHGKISSRFGVSDLIIGTRPSSQSAPLPELASINHCNRKGEHGIISLSVIS